MSSEDMGLVPSQRLENGLNSHLVFQDDALRFNCGAPAAQRRVGGVGGGEVPKTRDLSGFIDERFFAPPQSAADFRRSIYGGGRDRRDPPEARTWSGNGAAATPSVDGSEDDEDEDEEEDDVEDDDDEVADEGLVGGDGSSKGNNSNNGSNGEGKIGNGKQKHHNQNQSHHHHHHFGVNMMVGSSSRDVIVKESGIVQQAAKESPHRHNHQLGRLGSYHQNAVTVAENDGGGGDAFYSQYFQGPEGLSAATGSKDLGVENGCGFSGRKDSSYSNDSGESLRTILSDPVTGAFMDDAVILPCGHSFGSGGIQHVIRMKSCYTCSQSISEDSIAPNLSLRDAVQAFRREEELQFQRSSKKKRERLDQDKGIYGDSGLMELPRGRGVQFPFAVTDRVIIKGNKRTPQRFVGREAVVTTQCLNGWYVVKTLDNAESVKLQYRSLAKVPDDPLSKPMSSKMAPNWL